MSTKKPVPLFKRGWGNNKKGGKYLPYSDEVEAHIHIWKDANLIEFYGIGDKNGNMVYYEQNSKSPTIETRTPVDYKSQYCCVCHQKRPPVFKMKTVTDTCIYTDWCNIYNDETVALLNKNPNSVAALEKGLKKVKIDPPDAALPYLGGLSIGDDDAKGVRRTYKSREEELSIRKRIRDSVNEGIGEFVEPTNTSRNIMVGGIQRRPKRRRKPSIFLPPYNKVDVDIVPEYMKGIVLIEKTEGAKKLFGSGGKYMIKKEVKVKLLDDNKKYLEIA